MLSIDILIKLITKKNPRIWKKRKDLIDELILSKCDDSTDGEDDTD
jgi:hypothetical protein